METLTQYRIVRKLGRYALQVMKHPYPVEILKWDFVYEARDRWKERKQDIVDIITEHHKKDIIQNNWDMSPMDVIEYYPPLES